MIRRAGRAASIHADLRDGHQHDDHREEQGAYQHGTHAKTTISLSLCQQVAECGPEGAGQDVGNPEGQNGVAAHAPGRVGGADQRTECHCTPGKAQAQCLGRQIASSAQRKRGEDGGPIEQLPVSRHDVVDGQGALDPIPDKKDRGERHGERRGADVQADAKAISQQIGDLGADHADQYHRQPVNPRGIAAGTQLHEQRGCQ